MIKTSVFIADKTVTISSIEFQQYVNINILIIAEKGRSQVHFQRVRASFSRKSFSKRPVKVIRIALSRFSSPR